MCLVEAQEKKNNKINLVGWFGVFFWWVFFSCKIRTSPAPTMRSGKDATERGRLPLVSKGPITV